MTSYGIGIRIWGPEGTFQPEMGSREAQPGRLYEYIRKVNYGSSRMDPAA